MRSNTIVMLSLAFVLLFLQHTCWAQDKPEDDIPDILLKRLTLNLSDISFGDALNYIYENADLQLNYNRDCIHECISIKDMISC